MCNIVHNICEIKVKKNFLVLHMCVCVMYIQHHNNHTQCIIKLKNENNIILYIIYDIPAQPDPVLW